MTTAADCFPIGPEIPLSTGPELPISTLAYEQRGALGFCPEPDSVHSATIAKVADGVYSLEMSIFVVVTFDGADDSDCSGPELQPLAGGDCGRSLDLPMRLLSASEIQRIADVHSSLEEETVYFEPTPCAIDPCRVEIVQFDDKTWALSGDVCPNGNYTRLTTESRKSVQNLFDSLRP